MPRWLRRVLARIHKCAAQKRVRFTHKALEELAALEIGLDEVDACDVLAGLTGEESAGRLRSQRTGAWMYVFDPDVGGTALYIKVILRANCVVLSFHEEVHEHENED